MNNATVGTSEGNTGYINATTGHLNASSNLFPQDPRLVAADNLWKVCSPILILLGTFGNIVTIVVLRRKSMWKMSSSPYLVVLGVSDIAVLYTALLRHWLKYSFGVDIREFSPVMCKLQMFSVYTSTDVSVWTLVTFSLERFIFVCFPFKAKTMCTRRRAIFTLALTFIALAILNSHLLYGFGSVYDNESSEYESISFTSHCAPLNTDYAEFYHEVWPWIDMSVFSIVPLCIIVVCNVSIVTRVSRTKETRAKHSSMVALLISLNTVFLVTTVPVCIYYIGSPVWGHMASHEESVQLTLWFAIVSQLMYLNNSVNFLFYCISNPTFRKEVKSLCGRRGAVGTIATGSVAPTGVSVIPLNE